MQTKTCTKCHVEQSIDSFRKNRTYIGGHINWCKSCEKAYHAENYRRKREQILARNKQWQENNPQLYAQQIKEWRDRNKEKTRKWTRESAAKKPYVNKAGRAVRTAVRRGELPHVTTRQCEICQAQAEHYHHWSYLKEHWLSVVPLCNLCHRRLHIGKIKSDIPVPSQ